MSLGGGIIGGMLTTALGVLGDQVLGGDDVKYTPIPSFQFEVGFFESEGYNSAVIKLPEANLGNSLLGSLKTALPTGSLLNLFDPGTHSWDKAFIEVSGLEMGSEPDQKQEGGNNYPLNLPGKMKNQNVTLKRLVRPEIMDTFTDPAKWNGWVKACLEAQANWANAIITKTVQINIMHPMLAATGKPYIILSIELLESYPVKVSYGTLSSSSEDLLTQEIEIAYKEIKIITKK
jgi:phage tail-like protein